MKTKVLNALLILSSCFGYLEWGRDNSMFLLRGEWDVLQKLFTAPTEVIHPFILLPLAGQILLLITLFQRQPARALTIFGILGIGSLLVFISFIGILSTNDKIFFSTVPFITLAVLQIRNLRVKKKTVR